MSELSPAAVDASTRLLRVLISFTAQLDPVKEAKAATLKGLAEEVYDIGKEYGERLSSDVLQLLTSASSSLSSSTTSTVPYTACLSVAATVHQALQLLAVPPSPPRPSPFSRLPAELVVHVVRSCQFDDLRVRQSTNLALSRTSRLFHRYTSPFLATEMYLFTAGQIERAAAVVAAKSKEELFVKDLVIDVALKEIERKSQDSWAGRRIKPLIDRLVKDCSLRKLHLDIRSPTPPGQPFDPDEYRTEVLFALGQEANWHAYFLPNVGDLRLPALYKDCCREMYAPPAALRRLSLGASSPPSLAAPEHWHRVWVDALAVRPRQRAADEPIVDPCYEVLAVPYFTLFPNDALPLVLPFIPILPTLRHLEITFAVRTPQVDYPTIASMLRNLAPTLRRLALRFLAPPEMAHDNFRETVLSALVSCTLIEHLELGGQPIEPDLIMKDVAPLPCLRTLVLHPTGPAHAPLSDELGVAFLHHLRHLTVYIPPLSTLTPHHDWNGHAVNCLTTACEEQCVELVVIEERAHRAWLLQGP